MLPLPLSLSARILRLLFAALVTLVALACAEYVLRFEYRRAHSSGNARDYVARQSAGPMLRTNGLGFRDREVPPKSPSRYRIIVVGDSFTWGQGIEESERFSNLLESFLGPRYEVFNFGQPGNNMPEHLEVLTKALAASPDYVLLQLYTNDWETQNMERPRPYPLLPEWLDRRLEPASLLYDRLRDQWGRLQQGVGLTESYEHYMARNLRDPNAPNARLAYGQLHEFFDRARAAGVRAGAVMFPATDALGPHGSRYPFGYLHEGVTRTCAEERIECLDLLSTFSIYEDPRVTWVSAIDAHPNAMANRRAVDAMLQTFGHAWHEN